MSDAPVDLAELAANRLDGDLADEAWRALEQTHGPALAQALAREAATRDALRALPRAPAPKAVHDVILARVAAARASTPVAPVAPAIPRRSSRHWWMSASVLAAACLVTGIVLRVEHAATREQPRVGDDLVARAASAPVGAREREISERLAKLGPEADKRLDEESKGAALRRLEIGPVAADTEVAMNSTAEPEPQKAGAPATVEARRAAPAESGASGIGDQDVAKLSAVAQEWRATHAAKAAATPVPESVLEEARQADAAAADKAGGDPAGNLALKDSAPKPKPAKAALPLDDSKVGGDERLAAAAPPQLQAGAGPAADAAPAGADRFGTFKTPTVAAAAPATAAPAGAAAAPGAAVDPGARLAGTERRKADGAAAPGGAAFVDNVEKAEKAEGEQAGDSGIGSDLASAVPVRAELALDTPQTAAMRIVNGGPIALTVRRDSLVLEGLAGGAAVWTLTTAQPPSELAIPAGQTRSWRIPLSSAAAMTGATQLRLRCGLLVSAPIAWPPAPAAAAPRAQP